MKCLLCKSNEANKKNTHFLTDAVIRSCLNQDGSKGREEGFYSTFQGGSGLIGFNFQRNTNIEKVENSMNRKITEDDITKAKVIPFSVNYKFCGECEKRFTEIETKFIKKYLHVLRDKDLESKETIEIAEDEIARLFFILQIWRSAVCVDGFELPVHVEEDLRKMILAGAIPESIDSYQYPIIANLLMTQGEPMEYTSNMVGFVRTENAHIIFFNDFVIQFRSDPSCSQFVKYYNLNDPVGYEKYLNNTDGPFKIRVLNNKERQLFYNTIRESEVDNFNKTINEYIDTIWLKQFGEDAPLHIHEEFISFMKDDKDYNVLKHSIEGIARKAYEFCKIKGIIK